MFHHIIISKIACDMQGILALLRYKVRIMAILLLKQFHDRQLSALSSVMIGRLSSFILMINVLFYPVLYQILGNVELHVFRSNLQRIVFLVIHTVVKNLIVTILHDSFLKHIYNFNAVISCSKMEHVPPVLIDL